MTEEELSGAFDAVEEALWSMTTDFGMVGIAAGMIGAQKSPTPTMSITISGPGFAYDQNGERIFINAPWQPQLTNGLDLTADSNLVPTAVVASGNEKWLSVYVKFKRVYSDPRTDGNSNVIQFQANESYEFVVVQGVEDLYSRPIETAVRPTIDPTLGVLLFDVSRRNNSGGTVGPQTQIFNADIDTTRRQDTFFISQSPVSIRGGTLKDGLVAILQALNNHINGIGGAHPDTGITSIHRAGSPLDLPAGTVGSQLEAIRAYIDGALQTALGGLGVLTDHTGAYKLVALHSNFGGTLNVETSSMTTSTSEQVFSAPTFTGIPVKAGDYVKARFLSSIDLAAQNFKACFSLNFINYVSGTPPSMDIAIQQTYQSSTAGIPTLPISIECWLFDDSVGSYMFTDGFVDFAIGCVTPGTGYFAALTGEWRWEVEVWRPTGVAQ